MAVKIIEAGRWAIPKALQPIIKVLYDTFPWVADSETHVWMVSASPKDPEFMHFEMNPIPTVSFRYFGITVVQERNGSGCLCHSQDVGLFPTLEGTLVFEGIHFTPDNEIDAIGAVSAFVETMQEDFFEEQLATNRISRSEALLSSPSGKMVQLFVKKYTGNANLWVPSGPWKPALEDIEDIFKNSHNAILPGIPVCVGDYLKGKIGKP
jgi:hypothetical protein